MRRRELRLLAAALLSWACCWARAPAAAAPGQESDSTGAAPRGEWRPRRHHRLSLDGGGWTLSNKARGLQVAGTVPGGVYSDLRASRQLPRDIFYRFNDEEYRWVSKENWTYDRSFQVSSEALAKAKQILVLDGVDTVADVYLNGQLLGRSDNMFVRLRYDVKGVLKDGANLLEVRFTSPVLVARQRAAEQAKQYVVPPECPDVHYRGECGVNHLRKMQASFAWDWGPAFPSMGLWKGVHLESYDEAVLRDVVFSSRPTGAAWKSTVRVHWETGADGGGHPPVGKLAAALIGPDGAVAASKEVVVTLAADRDGTGHTDLSLSVPKSAARLWWPSGHGPQDLYHLNVSLRSAEAAGAGSGWDHVGVRVGLRTVELVQEEVLAGQPDKGLTYYFRVNGAPVFAKGSNWIPAHVLPELGADRAVVRHLLLSAKEANMNMLRVWGGGVYESDTFYQLADELGILVWQDLMFACAMYPTGRAFLRSVDAEVRQQYRRLAHHPSVALWAGNNENEAALRGNWYGTARLGGFDQFRRDYVKLYVDTARAAVRDEGSTAPFVVSSPSNGAESEAEGFVAKNPYSELYGDDHHYDYTSDGWNPAVFRHTRFGSEYGFMSWPSRTTMMTATDPEHADEDLALGSELAASRQHHPGGNLEMALQILQHLPLPADFNKSEHFDTFVYYSQIYQAMATKTETEFLRRSQNLLTPRGEGRTMGALYWQLNDVWQAPSWASIDFGGRWKMLHHMAVDFFAPLIVSPHVDGGDLRVDVVCDDPRHDVVLVRTDVLGWDSFRPRTRRVDSVRLRGAGSTPRALAAPLEALLQEAGCHDRRCVLRFRLTSANGSATEGPDNYLFPRSPKDTLMPNATLQVTSVRGPLPGTRHQRWDYALRLTASSPAAFVWLDAGPHPGRFSRNGFHLTDAAGVELRFHTDERVAADSLAADIRVTALNGAATGGRHRTHDRKRRPGH